MREPELNENERMDQAVKREEYMEGQQENFSLEENFEKLEEMIEQLEREDLPLEEAFQAYSAGMAILKQCNEQIDRVEKQVLKLSDTGELEEFNHGDTEV